MSNLPHRMPGDLRKALTSGLPAARQARATWDDITPLARNEWICWVTSGKKAECAVLVVGLGVHTVKPEGTKEKPAVLQAGYTCLLGE